MKQARAIKPDAIPDDATICRCNGVSKAAIVACVHDGAASVPEVAAATRATTGCGGCSDDVCALLDWLSPAAGTSGAAPTTTAMAFSPSGDRPGENHVTKGKHMNHNAETAAS